MNCKGGHFSLVNIVLGGQYPPRGTIFTSEFCPRGTIFTGEKCPGGQYSPVNIVPLDILGGDSIHCNTGTETSSL